MEYSSVKGNMKEDFYPRKMTHVAFHVKLPSASHYNHLDKNSKGKHSSSCQIDLAELFLVDKARE